MLIVIVAVVVGLLALAVWYFLGAVMGAALVAIMLIITGIHIIKRSIWVWRNHDRIKAAEGRRKAFEADLDDGIRQHRKLFPEPTEVDENGIEFL
jgi:small-conductance mechanosensitive channel